MKKTLWVLVSVLLVALLYYVLVRPYEFQVRFKADTVPGDIIGTIRIWNKSMDSAHVLEVDSLRSLKQIIVRGDRKYVYDWRFSQQNDSVTKVTVQIAEPGRGVINKLLIPFTRQPIESDADAVVRGFYEVLKTHLNITKVNVIGEVELDSVFCVCRQLEVNQSEKAYGMMKDYSLLTSFISDFNLLVHGLPMVRVQEWNHNAGELKFDFCFPIVASDTLPMVKDIIYKKFPKQKVLKAEYFGNYITSDRAWYVLLQYAKKKGYKTSGLPIEYFHNNPNLGIRETEWKADVYMTLLN